MSRANNYISQANWVFRLAQARTGTGKTLAFLLPVLQNIIKAAPSLQQFQRGPQGQELDIRAIVISPTRELAEQIAVEAQKIVASTNVVVQTAVGGTGKTYALERIKRQGCHILVGTPGRLNDLLSDPMSGVRAPKLSALVLDEADRLLDAGFAPDIKNIADLLPDPRRVDRQTLMFSATVPREVLSLVRTHMKPDFQFVQTVQPGEQQTHERVPQKIVEVAGFENITPALLELFKRELAKKDSEQPFKAIVFFNANAEVTLTAEVFQRLRDPQQGSFSQHPFFPTKLVEMHARLSQRERTYNSNQFREASTAIMFSSDVSARGMDFPNVTHIIQLGLPQSKDTYIHRLGRTARGDKKGEGWIFLTPFEKPDTTGRLRDLPLKVDNSIECAQVDMTKDAQLPIAVAETLTQIVDASKLVDSRKKTDAYLATLGIYQWYPDKQQLLDFMNNRSRFAWGLPTPPSVPSGLASKLGLRGLEGLNVQSGSAIDGLPAQNRYPRTGDRSRTYGGEGYRPRTYGGEGYRPRTSGGEGYRPRTSGGGGDRFKQRGRSSSYNRGSPGGYGRDQGY